MIFDSGFYFTGMTVGLFLNHIFIDQRDHFDFKGTPAKRAVVLVFNKILVFTVVMTIAVGPGVIHEPLSLWSMRY